MVTVNHNKVSVIIPTYKRSVMLARAIRSVLNQTYENLEIIIVDDNNEGDVYRLETEVVMEEFKNEGRVRYLKHTINKNGAAARNTGIKEAEGDYVAFLDDDDYFLPEKIEKQVAVLQRLDHSWGGVTCYHARKYKDYIYKHIAFSTKEDGIYTSEFLSGKLSMPSTTLIFRKSVFDNIGLFDELFYRHQDLEFLVRFFRQYKMSVVEDTLMVMQVNGFRNFPSGKSSVTIKNQFIDKFNHDLSLMPHDTYNEVMHYQWLPVAGFLFRDGDFALGWGILRSEVFKRSKSPLRDILTIIYYMLVGTLSFFREFHAFIVGKFKYNNLNQSIKKRMENGNSVNCLL